MARDRGLPVARTILAWRRTGLAYAGGSALAARLLFDHFPVAALGIGVVGIALSLGAYLAAEVRHRRMLEELPHVGHPDGGALQIALMASAAATVVLGGALYLLLESVYVG